jgi:MFS transporter, DHA2 family, multidrug resistance protein
MEGEENGMRWWILLTVIIGTFLGRLDQTIVNLALPKIINDFSITVTQAGYIATAYILANAVFVPIWGKLGDTIGRKKVYVMGFTIFIFGSLLAGLSWDLGSMIVFRIIQAIAGSADYPTAMSIIAVTFKAGRERAQALGIWSSAFAASAVFGPLIGGPIIDNLGWRWIFLINLPIGLVGLAMAFVFIKESVSERPTVKFDWWGALTLGISLAALVFVLDQGTDWGWMSESAIACYLTVLAFGGVFYLIDRAHPEPMVDFRLFNNSAFIHTNLNNFIIFMGMMGGVFLLPIFAQTYMGLNATETGYLFMPMAFGMVIAAPLGASLTGKVQPRYVIAASTAGAAVGMYLFTGLDARSGPTDVIFPLVVMACSMGFGMAQRTNIIASAVPSAQMGMASSTLALVRNIAGAFGIALFGTLLTDSTENNVLNVAKNTVLYAKTPLAYQQAAGLVVLKAQILAYHSVFVYASILLALGAVLSLWIRVSERKDAGHVMVE